MSKWNLQPWSIFEPVFEKPCPLESLNKIAKSLGWDELDCDDEQEMFCKLKEYCTNKGYQSAGTLYKCLNTFEQNVKLVSSHGENPDRWMKASSIYHALKYSLALSLFDHENHVLRRGKDDGAVVVFVDDEDSILHDLLGRSGPDDTGVSAQNLFEGVDLDNLVRKVKENSSKAACLVLDIHLQSAGSKVNGLELLHKLLYGNSDDWADDREGAELLRTTPVIMMSRFGDEWTTAEALTKGADGYITKRSLSTSNGYLAYTPISCLWVQLLDLTLKRWQLMSDLVKLVFIIFRLNNKCKPDSEKLAKIAHLYCGNMPRCLKIFVDELIHPVCISLRFIVQEYEAVTPNLAVIDTEARHCRKIFNHFFLHEDCKDIFNWKVTSSCGGDTLALENQMLGKVEFESFFDNSQCNEVEQFKVFLGGFGKQRISLSQVAYSQLGKLSNQAADGYVA